MPVSFACRDELFEEFDNGLVEGFGETICSRVVGSGRHILYPVFVAKPGICLTHELRTIVMYDPSGNIELINDMVFDEVDYINSLNFDEWYCFRPF